MITTNNYRGVITNSCNNCFNMNIETFKTPNKILYFGCKKNEGLLSFPLENYVCDKYKK